MADKKLSSVSAVSDMNFVYAETSSGETVKISKADLASVVAGVINPIKAVSAPTSIDERTVGLYYFHKNTTTGTFPSLSFNYGLVFCLGISGIYNQFLFPTTYQGKIYHRVSYENTWKDWKEISQS